MRYLSRTHKKACNGLDNWQAYSKSEISMKQTASHSQTPTFVKNESNTKPVLYQHPTPAEMRTPRTEVFRAHAKEAFIFVFLIALPCWVLVSLLMTWIFGG